MTSRLLIIQFIQPGGFIPDTPPTLPQADIFGGKGKNQILRTLVINNAWPPAGTMYTMQYIGLQRARPFRLLAIPPYSCNPLAAFLSYHYSGMYPRS